MPRSISILGSTGSIGSQTLDVISRTKDQFDIKWLTINSNIDELEKQCEVHNPYGVVITNKDAYENFVSNTKFKGKVLFGRNELINISKEKVDLLVSSLVGFAGVEPTLAAIKEGIDIALANKETLVSAGSVITKEANKYNSKIIAVDSEHNAILQCLVGEEDKYIEKLILTASGGPFRKTPIDKFKDISIQDALNHPNWSMGSKITIDSATMMNKGLEVIEAYWLFGVDVDKIDVLVHPQSIIHSMVQFIDGSTKAQMGLPDMRVPISYALTYPERLKFDFPIMDLTKISTLEFEAPDLNKFKNLKLTFDVLDSKPEAAVVLNAANEIAVYSFLNSEISFIDIPDLIEESLNKVDVSKDLNIEQIIDIDLKTRSFTKELIRKRK